MTPSELQQWSRTYKRDQDAKIRRWRLDRQIADLRESNRQLHRAEEGLSYQLLRSKVSAARSKCATGAGIPVALAARWNAVAAESAGIVLPADQPHIETWQRHVKALTTSLSVSIEWAPTRGLNAYANPGAKRIECAPVTSAGSYAVILHEFGHVACPCRPEHRRVTVDERLKRTVCVADELAAWRWAIDAAQPAWTARMHDRLADALSTYAQYGTAEEQRAIKELTSGIGFRQIQLRKART